jgi:hypothetical protein
MLGHGSPYGLLNPGQFPDAGLYIIDESMVIPLKNKSNSVYIWCYAGKFAQKHGLAGLNCGMFISFNNGYKRYHLTEHFDTTLLSY